MFKKRITRLIILIVSYLFLVGASWMFPTIHMTNNIFKNIAILLVGQPILNMFIAGCIAMVSIFLALLAYAIVYAVVKWVTNGDK